MPKQSPNLIPPIKKGVKPSASDTIDAKLTKGEAVLPAPVVKMLGKPFVKKLISLVPPDKGAKTVVKDGVLHAAGGADPDALKRINDITGVSGRGQGSIPMPAEQANAQMAAKQAEAGLNAANTEAFNQAKMDANARVSAARSAANSATPIQPVVNDTTLPKAGAKGFLGRLGEGLSSAGAVSTQIASDVLMNPKVAQGRDDAIKGLVAKSAGPNPYLDPIRDYASRNIIEPLAGELSGAMASKPSMSPAKAPQTAATAAFSQAEGRVAADSILSKQGAVSQSTMDRATPAAQPAGTAPERPAAGVQMDQSRYNKTGPMQPITNFNDGKGGSASVQFADGRTLNETQQDDLQKTIARNADPAVQDKFAEQAAISQGRYDRAKAFDVAKQQEQQKAMLDQQIQSAYNTLLQPQITGDLFGAINQKKQQAAASDFLRIANQNEQSKAALQTNQSQFGVNKQLAADRLKFDKENAVATNALEAQKQQDENDYKTAEQMKPTVVSKKRYNQDGIPIDEDQSVMQFDPRTKGFSVTPVKENETPESLFTQALKEANAEKDPRKRKYLIDYANQAYSSTLQTKAK